MERRYSEKALRKRRVGRVLLLAMVLLAGVRLLAGKPGDLIKNIMAAGTECVLPQLFRYQEQGKEAEAPMWVRVFTPAIFAYTWQEDFGFSVLEEGGETVLTQGEVQSEMIQGQELQTQDQEDLHEPSIYISVSQENTLSLLQENIFQESNRSQEVSVPNPFTGNVLVGTSEIGIGEKKIQKSYDLSMYGDMAQLIKEFYIVDASTSPDENLLDMDKLTAYDCTVDKNSEGPQILIYHSHSQEAFADSIKGDISTTIVGAGEKLARLLQEEYGYQVLHHTGVYDVPSRDNAYSSALPAIEQVLADNPTIQVVIDLHRDAVAEGTKLVTTIDGKDYARFMFFNGICRSTNGPITYLNNPYLEENMAFSFQAQVVAESYFPGVTRKIYLKAWRYNMHLKPRNMLIELGAQTNTVEEIMNTTEILAFVIDKVLSGQ